MSCNCSDAFFWSPSVRRPRLVDRHGAGTVVLLYWKPAVAHPVIYVWRFPPCSFLIHWIVSVFSQILFRELCASPSALRAPLFALPACVCSKSEIQPFLTLCGGDLHSTIHETIFHFPLPFLGPSPFGVRFLNKHGFLFFSNSLLEIWFTYHWVYLFKVYDSLA